MKNELNNQLITLERKLNESYERDFDSDEEEYNENKKIKTELADFIIKSHQYGELDLVEAAVKFLFDNTGCQEDYEILEQVIQPLLKLNILNQDLIKMYLSCSPLARWE